MKIDSLEIGVYLIRNTVSGLVYVGSTGVSFRKRCNQHRSDLKKNIHANNRLQNSWNKHSEAAFSFEVVEVVDLPEMVLAREQFWIDFYKARGKIANVCVVAGSMLGVKWTPETNKMCLPRESRNIMIAEYLSGASFRAAGLKIGTNGATCKRILLENGIEIRQQARKILSESERIFLVERYLDGESTVKIAQKLGTSPTVCSGILRRKGVELRPTGTKALYDWEKIAYDYAEGISTIALSKKYNVCRTTIRAKFQEIGVSIREKSISLVSTKCDYCGATMQKTRADINRTKKNFCNKQHAGRYKHAEKLQRIHKGTSN